MAADDRDENFLARWSRLKRAPEAPPPPEPAAEAKAVAKPPAAAEEAKEKADPAELPSIDSLTAESDFSAFLREGVPDALRRQALRKLWVSDPVIAATDVLDVYNLDYFNMPSFPEGVKTLFRVGHGMLDEADLEKERLAQAAAAKEPGAVSGQTDDPPPADAAGDEPTPAPNADSGTDTAPEDRAALPAGQRPPDDAV